MPYSTEKGDMASEGRGGDGTSVGANSSFGFETQSNIIIRIRQNISKRKRK
jgi:hypothetical protein